MKKRRFASEALFMKQQWRTEHFYDPSYNPNFSLRQAAFAYAFPPRLPTEWHL